MLQHDQGREFRGAVQRLMESMQVRIIESSPYHPQSQGKVERTHRVLRKKIMYDLVTCQRNGVNWVKHLQSYSRVLNEDPKEVLSWMSPFEVYYGRKSNMVMLPLAGSPSSVIAEQSTNDPQSTLSSLKQQRRFEEKRRRQRQMAKKANEHCSKRMIWHASKKNPPSVYHVSETVLVRVKNGAHRVSKVSGVAW